MARPSGALLLSLALTAHVGCGGSTPSSGTPHGPDAQHGAGAAPGAGASDGDETEGTADEPPPNRCADGTCFACGAGICPTGFYCDEGAAGGAACAWQPECASDPSCGCLGRVLGGGCRCEATGGGNHVKCE